MTRNHEMIGLLCVVAFAQARAAPAQVAADGPTVVEAAGDKMTAQVTIQTHEQSITVPLEGKPASDHSSCTYSRTPCSSVDSLEISIDGKPLPIPRSLFADLADVDSMEVKLDGKEGRISMQTGDAAEGRFVEIEFDDTRVKRRTSGSLLVPGEVTEEFNYYEATPLD